MVLFSIIPYYLLTMLLSCTLVPLQARRMVPSSMSSNSVISSSSLYRTLMTQPQLSKMIQQRRSYHHISRTMIRPSSTTISASLLPVAFIHPSQRWNTAMITTITSTGIRKFSDPKQLQHSSHYHYYHQRILRPSSHRLLLVATSTLVTTTAAILYHNDAQQRRLPTFCHSMADPNDSDGVDKTTRTRAISSPSLRINANEELSSSPPPMLFSPSCLDYDHYNGVTIDLERIHDEDEHHDGSITFAERLERQLQIWKAEGIIRGVWIHVPSQLAAYVPTCIENGFDFHMVTPSTVTVTDDTDGTVSMTRNGPMTTTSYNSNILILSQWLPENSTSRLPVGPTHQVGVGCLIWHPDDAPKLGPQRRLLVVQEKSGPAAAFQLWKLPTGLADPNEDIHTAAMRELQEETGLVGHFDGLLLVRQAHPNVVVSTSSSSTTQGTTAETQQDDTNRRSPKTSSVQRKTSDLFFVCQMTLPPQKEQSLEENSNAPIWTACPDEIAAIQWMSVQDYCHQSRWQSSPLYMELNRVIFNAASATSSTTTVVASQNGESTNSAVVAPESTTRGMPLWNDTTLPVWTDPNRDHTTKNNESTYTNTFYSVKQQ